MTWPQLLTILLTGVLAITASAVGQWVAARAADKRARADRAREDQHRFTDEKRRSYVTALEVLGAPTEYTTQQALQVLLTLALYDTYVAEAFRLAYNLHPTRVLTFETHGHLSPDEMTAWIDEAADPHAAAVDILQDRMRASLGIKGMLTITLKDDEDSDDRPDRAGDEDQKRSD